MLYQNKVINKKGDNMIKILKRKRGILMHPGTWVVVAFLLGILVTYLIARGVIPLKIKICP